MAEEKTLGLNEEPSSAPGSAENGTDNVKEFEDIEKQIDDATKEATDIKLDDISEPGDDEDTVVLSKKDAEKLINDRNNYKAGLLALKPKVKGLKEKAGTVKVEDKKVVSKNLDAPVTQKDLLKATERTAIEQACEDEAINDNWGEIIKNYYPKHGRDSVKNILIDIQRAKKEYFEENPEIAEKYKDKNKESNLAKDRSIPSGGNAKKEGENRVKKTIIPKMTPVKDWYKPKE